MPESRPLPRQNRAVMEWRVCIVEAGELYSRHNIPVASEREAKWMLRAFDTPAYESVWIERREISVWQRCLQSMAVDRKLSRADEKNPTSTTGEPR